jgi:zinc protease
MTTLSTMRRTSIAALALVLTLVLALVFVLTPTVATSQTPKEKPPAPGAPTNFRLADHRTFTMQNGMRVTLIHYGSVPKAVVSLEIRTGAIDEPPYGAGLAGLTADMLLQGTVARSAVRISRDAADMGGSIGASAGAVATMIGGEVLSEHTARFIALISDVARHPGLDKADFERVRANALRDLAINMQNASNIARQQWRYQVFPDHPFGRPYSSEATLKALTMGHVRNFLDDNYNATRAHLYVSGVFNDAAIEKEIRYDFSDWVAGPGPTVVRVKPVAERQVAMVDRPDAVQSTMIVGLPVLDPKSPDFTKFEVADALLGGAFGSRITSNIRENKGYTYSPYSQIWKHQSASYWIESADVTTKDTGNSLMEIFAEIERLRNEAPPAIELDGIKQNIVGIFTLRNSSRDGMVGQLRYVDEQQLGESYLTEYVRNVMAVTPEDVRRMAQQQLDPNRMTIVVVGDRKTVEAQIAPYRPPRIMP